MWWIFVYKTLRSVFGDFFFLWRVKVEDRIASVMVLTKDRSVCVCVHVHVLTVISTCKLDGAEAEDRRPAASWSRGALTLWHWHARVVIYCLAYTVVWVMSYEFVFVSVVILVAGSEEISGLMSDIYSVAPSCPLYLLPVFFPPPPYPVDLPSLVLLSLFLTLSPDSREESVLGSIPLPSYVISPVGLEDHINRKYTFKVRLFLLYRVFIRFWLMFIFFLSYSCTFSWFLVKNKTWNDSLWVFLIYWCPVSQLNHQNHLNIKI